MSDWKRNLLFIWISQMLSLIGFGFALPFLPFYLQEMGMRDPAQLRLWSGLFVAVAGVPQALFLPIWGLLADRYGRKPMTLRANLGGAVVLLGMGLVRTPGQLMVLRMIQGILTGTVTANLTLAVSTSPPRRAGLVIGLMNAAVFTGNALGPLAGGILADRVGFRPSFFVASAFLLGAFLISLLLVKERFTPAPRPAAAYAGSLGERLGSLRERLLQFVRGGGLAALTGLIFLNAFGRYMPSPIYPLRVQEIALPGLGVATQAGILSASGGVATVLAGLLIGLLAGKRSVYLPGLLCAAAGALFMAPQGLVPAYGVLVLLVLGSAFAAGGVDASLNILVAQQVRPERRGMAFGITGSASTAGWAFGALGAGALSAGAGFPATFLVNGALFLLVAAGLARLRGGRARRSAGAGQAPLPQTPQQPLPVQHDGEAAQDQR